MEELEKRMEALESEIELYREEAEEQSTRYDTPVIINGYVDAEYKVDSRSNVNSGFRLHHLSLFFKKQITQKWRFFSEIEYEDAPKFEGEGEAQPAPAKGEIVDDAEGKIFVEAVNIDYLWQPTMSFRVGRFFTPAGIWSIDHYPPFVPTQIRPGHIRKVFPQVVDGAAAYGTFVLGESFLNYDLFVGNGEGNTGKQDNNGTKAVGVRSYLLLPMLNYFEVGVSGYVDELNNSDDKTAIGMHLKIRSGMFTLQAEAADAKIEPLSAATYHTKGYYGQILYQPADEWTVGYRHDVYDEDDTAVKKVTTDSVFVNYHVNTDITLKAEIHDIEDEDASVEDHKLSIFSLVYYLGD
ncbi:MAG: hypothetical protein KAJ95_00050 [Gammaproteobacteria bacterium]|nr:hypothetical protein [Gammaproteobacteria bacterium]